MSTESILEAIMDEDTYSVFPSRIEFRDELGTLLASRITWHVFKPGDGSVEDTDSAICGVRFSDVEFPKRFPRKRAPFMCSRCCETEHQEAEALAEVQEILQKIHDKLDH